MPSASISPTIKATRRQPRAPRVPAPSAELIASVRQTGGDWIACLVGDRFCGYYVFWDGAWVGRNRRGGLPQTVTAVYNALSRARAASKGA